MYFLSILISLYCCRDLNIICEKISATGKDFGIEIVDGQPHDCNSSTKTITSVLEENK